LKYNRDARTYAPHHYGNFVSPYELKQEQIEVTIADLEDNDTTDIPF
jgi:hypothetical protein